jgi:hypothetical protein
VVATSSAAYIPQRIGVVAVPNLVEEMLETTLHNTSPTSYYPHSSTYSVPKGIMYCNNRGIKVC